MPPPESKLTLTDEEKTILKKWVEQGAEWRGHWSFLPFAPPPMPPVPLGGNEIDAFVGASLAKSGQSLRNPAPRKTLIRRVAFTLTGLPPAVEEMDAFLADSSPEAFAKVVNMYLSRPDYDERMAADWMDVARYADTYGYQSDRHREMSPWRDWVIRALNENLPYDQFITWQLAGDLLEKPSREQVLATAFNRLHRQTNEGGSVDEEYRVEYVNDRTTTYGTAFLGLTFECSRCHDHKYDPVSVRDFYSLTSFFANIQESGLYSHFTNSTPAPGLVLSTPEQDAKAAEAEQAIAVQSAKLRALRGERRAQFEKWLAARPVTLTVPDCTGDYPFETLDGNQSPNAVTDKAPAKAFEGPALTSGKTGNALLLDGENGAKLSEGDGFTRDDPFTVALWLQVPAVTDRAVVFHRSKAWSDAGSQGYEMLIENGKLTASVIHFWPGNAVSIRTKAALPVSEWTHVTMSYDGSSRAQGLGIRINGMRAECDVVWDKLYNSINESGVNEITIGQRFRDRGLKGGKVDGFKVFTRVLSDLEVAQLAGVPAAAGEEALYDYWLSALDENYRRESTELTELRKKRSALVDGIPEIMVMEESAQPKKPSSSIAGPMTAAVRQCRLVCPLLSCLRMQHGPKTA